ncbi:MAG: hypothetical protein JXA30_02270 [Deltaproteobacteria bacterium]|nr:hypothetical protein [Deltaproteobacteria bacterium]
MMQTAQRISAGRHGGESWLRLVPQVDNRLVMFCLLLAWLALGCGDKDGGKKEPNSVAGSAAAGGGESGSSGMSASGQGGGGGSATSGQGGGAGTTAGASGSAGSKEQTPPPENPRELGPPDGIYCESDFEEPPRRTCPAGSRCCPYGEDDTDPCILDGGTCHPCAHVTCGQLLCDGPEDCSSGQFCCYANQGSCKYNSDCTPADPVADDAYWMVVECQERCVGDQRDPDHGMVVCKDDRDCPGPYVAGRCRDLDVHRIPHGLKACFGLDI